MTDYYTVAAVVLEGRATSDCRGAVQVKLLDVVKNDRDTSLRGYHSQQISDVPSLRLDALVFLETARGWTCGGCGDKELPHGESRTTVNGVMSAGPPHKIDDERDHGHAAAVGRGDGDVDGDGGGGGGVGA